MERGVRRVNPPFPSHQPISHLVIGLFGDMRKRRMKSKEKGFSASEISEMTGLTEAEIEAL